PRCDEPGACWKSAASVHTRPVLLARDFRQIVVRLGSVGEADQRLIGAQPPKTVHDLWPLLPTIGPDIAKKFEVESLRAAFGHFRTNAAVAAGDPPHDAEQAAPTRQVEPDHGVAAMAAQFARAAAGEVTIHDPLRLARNLGHALSELGIV